MDKMIETNKVSLTGRIISGCSFSHTISGERFYMMNISVQRLSAFKDRIPVMVSERLIDVRKDYQGKYIQVNGEFRSYIRHKDKTNRLLLSLFVRELIFVEDEFDTIKRNQIYLDGYICKVPVHRKTPLGREITDVMLAVHRSYGIADYIPCICWGWNARYASGFDLGEHVQIMGRIQSREYVKQLNEGVAETRVVYEVSVSKMKCISG